MARTKRELDPGVKRDQIEEAACRLFLDKGYEDTSMAAVAVAAGVAPNTLYWYFASKDDLLVAVLDRLVNQAMQTFASQQDLTLAEQFKWLVGEFSQASSLVSTVHARLKQSDRVREWHDRFHAMLDMLLVQHLASRGMPEPAARMMATVGTFVVEGLLSHPHTGQQLETVARWLTSGGK